MKFEDSTDSQILDTDIAIVGGGGAGLAAALAAAENGVRNILILEARNAPGGNTIRAGGLFASESPVQKRLGIDSSNDELFKKQMDYTQWRINPRLVRAFIDKSGDTVRWLEEKGVKFDQVTHLYRNEIPTFHVVSSSTHFIAGAETVKALVNGCNELNVKILCQVQGKQLIVNNQGAVTGVIAQAGDKTIHITAKRVIIATGGFMGNPELMATYNPLYDDNIIRVGLPFKGDGLIMCTQIGASTEGLGTLEANGPDFWPSMDIQIIAQQPNTLWVNKDGERFVDENIASRSFGEGANAIVRQKERVCFSLLDQNIKHRNITDGFPGGITVTFNDERCTWDKNQISRLEKEIQTQVEKGRVKISESWAEIAAWIGVDQNVLQSNIDEYNSFCDKEHDDLFAKEARYLVPLRTPPFYAIKCQVHIYNTLGGIKINHRMEVLGKDDDPIPGLYAAGVDAGGWEEGTYNTLLAGHSFGFAINSGRIAGENAAKSILNQ